MNGKLLIDVLKQKFEVSSDVELSKATGISIATINVWKSDAAKLSPLQIGNLVTKARKQEAINCVSSAIQPIVEYFEINSVDSRNGANWEIISSKDARGKRIRKELETSNGIYAFYNSQGRVIYLGKAKKQNLWQEMKLAFNRNRSSQVVWVVNHPERGQEFTPAHEKLRRIAKTKVPLSCIASYFSAYKVNLDLIDNLEALMIRCFANDLTNTRMEKFRFE